MTTPAVPDLVYWQQAGDLVDALLKLRDAPTPENHAARNAAFDSLTAAVAAWAVEQDQPVRDAAWASVWLNGHWRWLTRCMSTEEREAAAGAVERHWARMEADDPDCTHGASDRMALRWWSDDALDTEVEDAVRVAEQANRNLERVLERHGYGHGRRQVEPTPLPASVALAIALQKTSENLAAHIERRAGEIADPKIAAAEANAADRARELEELNAAWEQRFADVRAEWDRQFGAVEQRQIELAWAARYLPPSIRRSVLSSGSATRHPYGRPKSDSFADRVDEAAARLGLTPYATTEGCGQDA